MSDSSFPQIERTPQIESVTKRVSQIESNLRTPPPSEKASRKIEKENFVNQVKFPEFVDEKPSNTVIFESQQVDPALGVENENPTKTIDESVSLETYENVGISPELFSKMNKFTGLLLKAQTLRTRIQLILTENEAD